MAEPTYWLDLFSGRTWEEFLKAGAQVSGFRASRWRAVQRMQPGDLLLCYMTGISRFVGLLEVQSEPYRDDTPIWHDEAFPSRVRVRLLVGLTPETGVPIQELRDRLSIFQNLTSPNAWTGRVRGSPSQWERQDGEAVVSAMREAELHPVHRAVDQRKLGRKPRSVTTNVGPVTVPDDEEVVREEEQELPAVPPRLHTSVQQLLLKLGSDMGLDVWVARNDRSREVGGKPISDVPRLRTELPRQFDDATNKTIEHIDVLWLRMNSIVAAFEIECTTSIYSGLLRMSDLVAMQPNLKIPLYLVAPVSRREKVVAEINRPTFTRLSPPLSRMCQFIPIEDLMRRVEQVRTVIRYLRPEFLNEVAEACDLGDGT